MLVYNLQIKVLGIQSGQWIVISSLGGLGNIALQYAKKIFNAKVTAVDINDSQLEFAKQYVGEYIQEHLNGAHAAVVTAVAKSAFNDAVNAVRAGGTVVVVVYLQNRWIYPSHA